MEFRNTLQSSRYASLGSGGGASAILHLRAQKAQDAFAWHSSFALQISTPPVAIAPRGSAKEPSWLSTQVRAFLRKKPMIFTTDVPPLTCLAYETANRSSMDTASPCSS